MSPETSNQLVGALARLNTQIDRQLALHEAAAEVFTDAKDKLDKSAKVLHDLRDAHFDLEFLITHGRLPVLFEQHDTTAPDGGDVRKRITDALLAPGVMQAVADLGEAVRAAHPFETQNPGGMVTQTEIATGERATPFDRVEELSEQRVERLWGELDSLIARLAETEGRAKILSTTRRAYDAAKAEM